MNAMQITLDVTGSDSDDDDMSCYVAFNIKDVSHFIKELKAAKRAAKKGIEI